MLLANYSHFPDDVIIDDPKRNHNYHGHELMKKITSDHKYGVNDLQIIIATFFAHRLSRRRPDYPHRTRDICDSCLSATTM